MRRGRADQGLAVAAAGQEGEALQVIAQLVEAVGGMAGELFQRCGQADGIAGQPGPSQTGPMPELPCAR